MARITSTLLLLMLFGCGENIQHDTELAARRAIEFAELAFVRQNLEKSHLLLADSARSYVPRLEKQLSSLTRAAIRLE